jgi:cytochrome b6-f complex iron-sulfur subunit
LIGRAVLEARPMKAIELKASTEDDRPLDGSRRRFCLQACLVASLGAAGVLLESCGGGNPAGPSSGNASALPIVSGSAGTNVVTLTVDSSSPLANVGSAALVQAGNVALLVAHTAQNTFTAMSSICTHAACQITGYTGSSFICPCHGSQFSTSGQVLNGPAAVSLRTFSTQFAGNVLTITLA